MTYKNTLTTWQKKYSNLADETLDLESFNEFVQSISTEPDILKWVAIVNKYKLPLITYGYVINYIRTGKKDPLLIDGPIYIVNDVDKTAVPSKTPDLQYSLINSKYQRNEGRIYLEISNDCNITDIKDFLDSNKQLIEEKLAISNRKKKPIRYRHNIKRDEKVLFLHYNGVSTKAIADEIHQSIETTQQIIRRAKKNVK